MPTTIIAFDICAKELARIHTHRLVSEDLQLLHPKNHCLWLSELVEHLVFDRCCETCHKWTIGLWTWPLSRYPCWNCSYVTCALMQLLHEKQRPVRQSKCCMWRQHGPLIIMSGGFCQKRNNNLINNTPQSVLIADCAKTRYVVVFRHLSLKHHGRHSRSHTNTFLRCGKYNNDERVCISAVTTVKWQQTLPPLCAF